MPGVFWLSFIWGTIAVFLIVAVCRMLAIARLPVHLRWELAPIPREKRKGSYGGSYLEEYEWWKKAPATSAIAPLLYMAREIFLLESVWKHNRSLWPFSFALHTGIYLFFVAVFFHAASLAFSLMGPRIALSIICLDAASVIALCGYLLGTAGTVGLLLRRIFDPNLRWSNSAGTFLNLIFLAAVFVSGAYAWLRSADAAHEVDLFIRRLITFDGALKIAFPFAIHVALFSLFCAYLPFTNMTHFIGKYFTYHRVRWNDEPLNGRMELELRDLLSQPVGWDAKHARADRRRSWAEVAKEEIGHEETQS